MVSAKAVIPLMCLLPAGVKLASRQGICELEKSLMQKQFRDMHTFSNSEMEQLFPLTHKFADGVYGRELFLPAGSIVAGKIHKFGHLNVISKGRCVVVTEFGVEEFTAPYTFISQPGTKRIVAAIEDTIWTTFHGVDSDEYGDVEAIEERIICKTFDEFDQHQLLLTLEK